jgi:hypothetical protein
MVIGYRYASAEVCNTVTLPPRSSHLVQCTDVSSAIYIAQLTHLVSLSHEASKNQNDDLFYMLRGNE